MAGRHGVTFKNNSPIIKINKKFGVNIPSEVDAADSTIVKSYDLEFVTFLREILNLGKEVDPSSRSWHTAIPSAEWVDQEQGIFRINNREEFCTMW